VDFLQLVAEKTEEGFLGNPEGIAFPLRGRWHEVPDEVFLRNPQSESAFPEGSLPCAKGGGICEANDGGIVIPSNKKTSG